MNIETKNTNKDSEERTTSEQQLHTSEMLAMLVQPDTKLKDMLVEYVGTKFDKEEVTVNMIVEALAHEFPEFVYVVAEENFLRGYQLGLEDAYKTVAGTPEEDVAEKL